MALSHSLATTLSSNMETAPLSDCCVVCQTTTDLALQMGPAYKIHWSPGAAAKKKRDDAEEQKDILDGFKRNCQKWREIIPDEVEDDGFSNPLVDAEDVEVNDEDEDSDESKKRTGARRVLSKLDGLNANTARHLSDAKINKTWQPNKYYNDEDDEDDLFPLPSPITSPRLGSPNVSSSNLTENKGLGFFSLPTIPGSTTHSLSGSDEGHGQSSHPLSSFTIIKSLIKPLSSRSFASTQLHLRRRGRKLRRLALLRNPRRHTSKTILAPAHLHVPIQAQETQTQYTPILIRRLLIPLSTQLIHTQRTSSPNLLARNIGKIRTRPIPIALTQPAHTPSQSSVTADSVPGLAVNRIVLVEIEWKLVWQVMDIGRVRSAAVTTTV